MSAAAFFAEDARRGLREAAASVEARGPLSLLVVVRPASGSYRHASFLGGALLALASLCVFLYHPEPFRSSFFPLEQALFFALGALLVGAVPPLRRALTGERERRAAVRAAAREVFVDRGVASTPTRRGVLVFVSVFEGCVEVVADEGVDVRSLGERWLDAQKKLERAVRRDQDPAALARAVRELGELLEPAAETADEAQSAQEPGDGAPDPEADA